MKLRYMVLDGRGQLALTPKADIEGLWHGRTTAHDLGARSSNEIRLVSVLCDNRLVPKKSSSRVSPSPRANSPRTITSRCASSPCPIA